MNERVRILREHLKLNQREFSNKINISQSTLALMESGQRSVRDIHVSQICSIFGVNEAWLRTGVGDMFLEQTIDDEFAEILIEATLSGNEQIKELMIRASKLNKKQLKAFSDLLDTIIEEE